MTADCGEVHSPQSAHQEVSAIPTTAVGTALTFGQSLSTVVVVLRVTRETRPSGPM